jgi:CarD family transcriptional regulator
LGQLLINKHDFQERFDSAGRFFYNNPAMMDSFSIGDKVIYPTQGIGVIEDIQEEDLYGELFLIYHLRILSNNTLIMVPSSNTAEIGIRKLISSEKINKVLDYLGHGTIDVSMNWKGRFKEHTSLMKTGSILDMAEVLKSLFYLNMIKPLSFREKKMMEKAKELLVTEISEVAETPIPDIERQLLDNLSNCFKTEPARLDS